MRALSMVAVLSAALVLWAVATPSYATVIYNETVTGDLSNDGGNPTALLLALGTNSVVGNLHITAANDTQDWVAVTIPVGLQLSSYVNSVYTSTDAQGFTGFRSGASFPTTPTVPPPVNQPGNYLGYAHFGTGATNGLLPPTNVVNQNLLPIMADNSPGGTSPGAQGFTPPVQAGTYTFLLQQTGSTATTYQFDWVLTAVPEPGTLCLAGLGCLFMLAPAIRCARRK